MPTARFAGVHRTPLRACTLMRWSLPNAPLFNTVPKTAFAKSPPCLKGGRGDSVSLPGNTVPMATFSGRPGRGVPTCQCAVVRYRAKGPIRPFGAPPPRGGGLFGAILKSTLPQLFIIQYSFAPMYHPGIKIWAI